MQPQINPTVPDSISRARFAEMIRALGVDTKNLIELSASSNNGITLRVVARDSEGHAILDGPSREVATHSIFIPLVDEDVDGAEAR